MHFVGLFSDTACQQDKTGINHINIAAASVTDIHKIKHLEKSISVLQ